MLAFVSRALPVLVSIPVLTIQAPLVLVPRMIPGAMFPEAWKNLSP